MTLSETHGHPRDLKSEIDFACGRACGVKGIIKELETCLYGYVLGRNVGGVGNVENVMGVGWECVPRWMVFLLNSPA